MCEEDVALFLKRQPPLSSSNLVDALADVAISVIGLIPCKIVVGQKLEYGQEKDAGAAACVGDGESGQVGG